MNNDKKNNLKLIGKNEEDLKIISAYLQDSVVIIKDIVFLKKNRAFIMILNRFMWEDVEKGVFRQNKRVRCALKFEEVTKVQSKNINQKNKNNPLEYLAIKSSLISDLNLTANGFGLEIDLSSQIAKKNLNIFEYGISYFERTKNQGKKITFLDGLLSYYFLFKARFLQNDSATLLSILYSFGIIELFNDNIFSSCTSSIIDLGIRLALHMA